MSPPAVKILSFPAFKILSFPAVKILSFPAVKILSKLSPPAVKILSPPAVKILSPAVKILSSPAVKILSSPAVKIVSSCCQNSVFCCQNSVYSYSVVGGPLCPSPPRRALTWTSPPPNPTTPPLPHTRTHADDHSTFLWSPHSQTKRHHQLAQYCLLLPHSPLPPAPQHPPTLPSMNTSHS